MEEIGPSDESGFLKQLKLAVSTGNEDMVKCLLRSGGSVNAKDSEGQTALHWACQLLSEEKNRSGSIQSIFEELLRSRADVGVKDNDGMTALHRACLYGLVDVIPVLVNNGADVNEKDNRGVTPLFYFCMFLPTCSFPTQNKCKFIDYMLNLRVQTKNDYFKTLYEVIKIRKHEAPIIKETETIFIKHDIKLEMFNPQVGFEMEWKLGSDFYHSVKYQCHRELEDMKSTSVVKDVPLYQVLSRTKPYNLLSTDDILHINEFLCSPDLMTRFPLYGLSLRTTFQRPKLLTLAMRSFYAERRKQMVKELPWEMAEQLLSYLTNEDLRNFIRSESCDERVNRCLVSFQL